MDHGDKLLLENKWLSVLETPDGYVYSRESRCGGVIVAVLVYDMVSQRVLGRFERTPAHGPEAKIALASITGGCENNDPVATAILELKEEAGIAAPVGALESLGRVRPSKSADTWVYLYALNGTGIQRGEAKGDGSLGEQGAYCDWVSVERAILCDDALFSVLLLRKMHQNDLSAAASTAAASAPIMAVTP